MASATPEPVALAILAKAPLAGSVKTRLIPALGAEGAAALHARLIERTVETACAAHIGPVTLWSTPATPHACFAALASRFPIALASQPDGDLGVRMLAACEATAGPAIVIGTDCPALTPPHLCEAADVLRAGIDAVITPAEDGGYVLIGSPDEVVEQIRHVGTSLNVGHLMLLLQYGNMSKDVTKYNTRLFAEKVMPKVKDLFGEWEDKWWPKPMAKGQRAAVPAFRPQFAAAE
jgi:rSAM/selenodomain-associated transferase 1